MKERLEPAASLIQKLGGAKVIADKITEVRGTQMFPGAVHRWAHDKDRGGTGGLIPSEHMATLRELGAERGVALTLEDFLPAGSAESPADTAEAPASASSFKDAAA